MTKIFAIRNQLVLALSILMTIGTAASRVSAEPEKMDAGTHRFLIEKLEKVIAATPKGDSTRVPALLRLADLYSEEARLLAMAEIEKGCFQEKVKNPGECGVSASSRGNAIKFYEMALNESSGASQSRILFQLAHLYEVNGEAKKATKLYEKIIALGPKHFSKIVLGQSQAGLGEIAFKDKRFSDAKKAFERALLNPETPRRGWVIYRIAWSELNLNQAESGKRRLVTILKTPALLTLESTVGSKQDDSFQEDVARDLTVFFAKTGFNQTDIDTLWSLSPDAAKKSILMELAEEAERLGQQSAAIAVWSSLATRLADKQSGKSDSAGSLTGREKIEAQVRVATLRFGLGDKPQAVGDFKTAMDLWKKNGCSPEAECAVLQKRLRKLVIDWNKNEETKLTSELLSMYRIYAGQFHDDSEMAYWGANVARELKSNREAVVLYRQAAEQAAKQVNAKSNDEKQAAQIRTVFEGSLLAEIEMAELTKDAKLRGEAYAHYLDLNPNGPKALEVRYQQAHMAYQAGATSKAADMFYQIAARDEKCRAKQAASLCRQAADLTLDSIVILKNDERLEATASEFAEIYSGPGAKDYASIARRARLNLAAKAANGNSSSAMNENLKKLSEANLKDASNEEVLLTHKNRFVLAEKTRNFVAANAAAVAIINFKGASAAEREDAMAKRLWVAEMQLDFGTAYVTARQMTMANLKPAERELKLALLAELAGREARPHLMSFVKQTGDKKAELAARVKLIKASNYSVDEFDRHFAALSRNVEILASVGLDVYARHPSDRLAKRLLAVRGFAKQPEGAVLARAGAIHSIESWAKKLAAARLPTGASDKVLQKALASRVKALADADRFANKQIQSQDGWLQALALQVVSVENRRMKYEIMALPLPKGLKEIEERRYKTLIAQKVAPFETKAAQIDRKLARFWSKDSVDSFARSIEQASGPKRALLVKEARSMVAVLNIISSVPGPAAALSRIESAVNSEPSEVRASSIASARDDVRKNPFDIDSLKRLRALEAEAGGETMVSYLDSRMTRLGARP